MADLSSWVVVFDLDDTLYYEDDYNYSGVIAVSEQIERLYGVNLQGQLLSVRSEKGDVLAKACELLALPESVKESFLWMYRLHYPKITLTPEISNAVQDLAVRVKQIAILTDGRSVSQRLKLEQLKLLSLPCYVSEDYSSSKPGNMRYQKIMADFPSGRYVYIGDNPAKDFIAPRRLGWKTICLRDQGRNIHNQSLSDLTDEQQPDLFIDSLSEVADFLC